MEGVGSRGRERVRTTSTPEATASLRGTGSVTPSREATVSACVSVSRHKEGNGASANDVDAASQLGRTGGDVPKVHAVVARAAYARVAQESGIGAAPVPPTANRGARCSSSGVVADLGSVATTVCSRWDEACIDVKETK